MKQCDLPDDVITEMFNDPKFVSGCGKRSVGGCVGMGTYGLAE